jgi:hypothetical protein
MIVAWNGEKFDGALGPITFSSGESLQLAGCWKLQAGSQCHFNESTAF